MLEIGAAYAEPQLATILLMGAPVTTHGKSLAALAAAEWFHAMLSLVVSLQGAEVLERLRTGMVDAVAAARGTAEAWKAEHGSGLSAFERVGTASVLGAMTPHVHLHVIITVECLTANRTCKLGRTNQYLGWCRNPELSLS